jgi:hypothetical protein
MTKYTFSTGTELVEVMAERLEDAILIIKAQYGCCLKIIKRERI